MTTDAIETRATISEKRRAILTKLSRGVLLSTDERYAAMNMEEDGLVQAGYVAGEPTWIVTAKGRRCLETTDAIETLTDKMITRLRAEASEANDRSLADTCDLAIKGDHRARLLCAKAINSARAMDDEPAPLVVAGEAFAVIEDRTPNRATVVAVGIGEDELRAEYEDRHDVEIIAVPHARVDEFDVDGFAEPSWSSEGGSATIEVLQFDGSTWAGGIFGTVSSVTSGSDLEAG